MQKLPRQHGDISPAARHRPRLKQSRSVDGRPRMAACHRVILRRYGFAGAGERTRRLATKGALHGDDGFRASRACLLTSFTGQGESTSCALFRLRMGSDE